MAGSIDAVILWVDGSDPNWLEEKKQYIAENTVYDSATNEARFRDWDNLNYIFAALKKICHGLEKSIL